MVEMLFQLKAGVMLAWPHGRRWPIPGELADDDDEFRQ